MGVNRNKMYNTLHSSLAHIASCANPLPIRPAETHHVGELMTLWSWCFSNVQIPFYYSTSLCIGSEAIAPVDTRQLFS